MYLVQERPVDNPTRREITKTTSLGKAFISEMKCIRNIRITAMKYSFHCNEMFSSLKWNEKSPLVDGRLKSLRKITPSSCLLSAILWGMVLLGWLFQGVLEMDLMLSLFLFFCLCLVVTLSAILWSFLWCPSRLDAFSWLGLTWDG